MMTNSEIAFNNEQQKLNKTRVENALKDADIKFETVRVEDYIFISIFHILDEEFVITPKGQLETTNDVQFDNAAEVVEYIQTNY